MAPTERLEAGRAVIELRAVGEELQADIAKIGKELTEQLEGTANERIQRASAERAKRIAGESATAIAQIGAGLFTALGAGVTALGASAISAFADFEEGFGDVETLLRQLGEPIEPIRQQLLALDPALGNSRELTEALYQALSAGVEPALAVEAVANSAQLARVAIGDLGATVTLTSGIIAGFGTDAVGGFEEVGNVLNTVVAQGVVRLEEMATVLPQATAAAILANGSFEDTAAVFGLLTQSGLNAARAATSLQAIFSELAKPGTELAAVLEDAGLQGENLGKALQEEGGLVEVLRQVDEAAAASGQTLSEVFAGREALRGIAFIQRDFDAARDSVDQFNAALESGISVNELFEARTQELRFQQETLGNAIERVRIEIGSELAPVASTLTAGFADIVRLTADWVSENKELIGQNIPVLIKGISDAFIVIKQILPDILDGIAVIPSAFQEAFNAADTFIKTVTGGRVSIGDFVNELAELNRQNSATTFDETTQTLRDLTAAAGELASQVGKLETQAEATRERISVLISQGDIDGANLYKERLAGVENELAGARFRFDEAKKAADEFGKATNGGTIAAEGLSDATKAAADALRKNTLEYEENEEAVTEVGAATADTTEQIDALRRQLAGLKIRELLDAVKAAEDMEELEAAFTSASVAIVAEFRRQEMAIRDTGAEGEELTLQLAILEAQEKDALDALDELLDETADGFKEATKETKKLDKELTDLEKTIKGISLGITRDLAGNITDAIRSGEFGDIGRLLADDVQDGFFAAVEDRLEGDLEDKFAPILERGITAAIEPLDRALIDPLTTVFSSAIEDLAGPLIDPFEVLFSSLVSPVGDIISSFAGEILSPFTSAIGDGLGNAAGEVSGAIGGLFSSQDAVDASINGATGVASTFAESIGPAIGAIGAVAGIGFGIASLFGLGDGGPTEVELQKELADAVAKAVAGALKSQDVSDALNEAGAGFGVTLSDGLLESIAGIQANFEQIFIQSILPNLPGVSDQVRDLVANAFENGVDSVGGVLNLAVAADAIIGALAEQFPDLSEEFLAQLFEGLRDPAQGAVFASPQEFLTLFLGFSGEELGAEASQTLADLTTAFGIAVADLEGLTGPERAEQIDATATALIGFAAAGNLTAEELAAFTEQALENLGVSTELFDTYRDLDNGLRDLLGVTAENREENTAYQDVLDAVVQRLGLLGIVIDDATLKSGDLVDIFIDSKLSAEEFAIILTALPQDVQDLIASLDPPLLESLQNVRNETLLGADAFVVLAGSMSEIVGTVTDTFDALDVGTQAQGIRDEIAGIEEQIESLGSAEDPDTEAIAALEAQLALLEAELEFVDGIIQKLNREGSRAIRDLADAALEDGEASASELAAIFEQITKLQEGLGEDLSEASIATINDVLQDLIIANAMSEEELRNLAGTAEDETAPAIEGVGDEVEDTGQKFIDLGIDATTAVGDIEDAVDSLALQLSELPTEITIDVAFNVPPLILPGVDIPEFAGGGVVPGAAGQRVVTIAEAGELIVPGAAGGGSDAGAAPGLALVPVDPSDLARGVLFEIVDMSEANEVFVDPVSNRIRAIDIAQQRRS